GRRLDHLRRASHQSEHAVPLRDEPERTQGLIRMLLEVLNRAPDSLQRYSCIEQPRHHPKSDQILERIYPSRTPPGSLPDRGADQAGPRPIVELPVGDPRELEDDRRTKSGTAHAHPNNIRVIWVASVVRAQFQLAGESRLKIGIDDFQSQRSPNGRHRTTPLKGLFARQKGG